MHVGVDCLVHRINLILLYSLFVFIHSTLVEFSNKNQYTFYSVLKDAS